MKRITFLFALVLCLVMQTFASDNIALNKSAASSSAVQSAALALDGNMGTRWESESSDPQSLVVDLGQIYVLDSVLIYWEGAFATAYTLEISSDSSAWTTFYTRTNSDGGTDTIVANPSGRYVRMAGTTRATQYGYSIFEFEVYGEPDATADATLSDLQVDGVSLDDFVSSTYSYTYEVAYGETNIPVVTATPNNAGAEAIVSAADAIPGTASILVTAANETTQQSYTVNFVSGPAAAPAPTKDAVDVISIYSDTYTSSYTDLDPYWYQATDAVEVQLEGNNTLQYNNLDYQGLLYPETDVTKMAYLHVDYFTNNATALKISVIGGGSENAFDVVADGEGITMGEWVSLDIPLTHYTSPDLSVVSQLKTEGNGTVYLDNIFYWKEPTALIDDVSLTDLTINGTTIAGFEAYKSSYTVDLGYGATAVPTIVVSPKNTNADVDITYPDAVPGNISFVVTSESETETATYTIALSADDPTDTVSSPTLAAENVISVYSDVYTSIVSNINPDWSQSTTFSELAIGENHFIKLANLNYQGIEYTEVDLSAMEYLHVDYWTTSTTDFDVYLIADGESAYDVDGTLGLTTASWQGIDIPLSIFADAGRDLTQAIQFKLTGDGTIYLDNLYFWKAATGADVATLSDLQIDGVTVTGFSPQTLNYEVALAADADLPVVTATATDANAEVDVTNVSAVPGEAKIVVTAEDGETVETYSVNFTVISHVGDALNQPFEIYPNPATESLYIESKLSLSWVEVYDISGQLAARLPVSNKQIAIGELVPGVYILKAADANQSYSRRFVKL